MERMKSSMQRLLSKIVKRDMATPITLPDELPRLSGEFNHENYPASAITECLDAYVNALNQLKSRTSISDLRARLDQLALTHDALAAELAGFAQRADKLSNAILALTAAAKPLQEPGIGPGDRDALRNSLAARADELKAQRDAYEADAKAYDARITEIADAVEAVRKDIEAMINGPIKE